MRRSLYVISIAIVCLMANSLHLYASTNWRSVLFKSDSPYEWSEKDKALFFWGGVVFATGVCVLDDPPDISRDDLMGFNRNDVPSFDRYSVNKHSEGWADWSDRGRDMCLALPALAFLFDYESLQCESGVILMYMESLLWVNGFTEIAKKSAQRKRPYLYSDDREVLDDDKLEGGHARQSFWSGHTALAFNAAVFFSTVWSDYHKDSTCNKYVWIGSLCLATSVAWGRIEAGEHFPTDVLMGAAIGGLTGWAIPAMHRKDVSESLVPIFSHDMVGIAYMKSF